MLSLSPPASFEIDENGSRKVLCVFVSKRGFWELPKGGVRSREGDPQKIERLSAQHWLLAETGVWPPSLTSSPMLRQGQGIWFAATLPVESSGTSTTKPEETQSLLVGHRAAWLPVEEATTLLRPDHRFVLRWALDSV
jgi:8-oxo-dGTP pyrophosphatase MutT (NUDIX family)